MRKPVTSFAASNSRSASRCSRLLARWSLALVLLAVAFAPRPVVASCGDYVTMGHDSSAAGQSAPAQKKSPCADGQCHNPCRNGQCQRAPAGLPPVPSSQLNLTIQQWALWVAALVDDSPRVAFRLPVDSRDIASGYPPSIDHPPQNLSV